jgi:hypothetical protein
MASINVPGSLSIGSLPETTSVSFGKNATISIDNTQATPTLTFNSPVTATSGAFSGAVTCGSLLAGDGSASAPSISFTSNPTTGIFKSGATIQTSIAGSSVSTQGAGGLTLSGSLGTGTNGMTCGAMSCSSLTSAGMVTGANFYTPGAGQVVGILQVGGAITGGSLNTLGGTISSGTGGLTCGAISSASINVSGLVPSNLVVTDGSRNLLSANSLSAGVLSNITQVTRTIISSGSGTYTTPANVTHIRPRVSGSAGGGGGCLTVAASSGGGGGGGGGGYSESLIAAPAASYAYSIDAGGAGGVAGANSGSSGGTTTFGSSLISVTGGIGGAASTASTSATGAPAASGVGSGGTLLNIAGQPGGTGLTLTGTVGASGSGGMGAQGAGGGVGKNVASTGVAGSAPGGGGSGGCVINGSASAAGGNGGAGLIIIEEYYVG